MRRDLNCVLALGSGAAASVCPAVPRPRLTLPLGLVALWVLEAPGGGAVWSRGLPELYVSPSWVFAAGRVEDRGANSRVFAQPKLGVCISVSLVLCTLPSTSPVTAYLPGPWLCCVRSGSLTWSSFCDLQACRGTVVEPLPWQPRVTGSPSGWRDGEDWRLE